MKKSLSYYESVKRSVFIHHHQKEDIKLPSSEEKNIDIQILLASAQFYEEGGEWYFKGLDEKPMGPYPSKLGALLGYENLKYWERMKQES